MPVDVLPDGSRHRVDYLVGALPECREDFLTVEFDIDAVEFSLTKTGHVQRSLAQGFGRDHPNVSHPDASGEVVTFDDRYPLAEVGSMDRCFLPRRPGPDHDQVVPLDHARGPDEPGADRELGRGIRRAEPPQQCGSAVRTSGRAHPLVLLKGPAALIDCSRGLASARWGISELNLDDRSQSRLSSLEVTG
jgi:hypothetical protein